MIQTVTGAISENFNKKVLIHEHISCVSNDMLQAFGRKWLDESELIERSVKIIASMKERYGLGMIVDGTPLDLGRNAKILKEISEKSGVKILASCGLYIYPSMISLSNSEEDLANIFLEETENGLDRSDIKPGILKCATDNLGITEENERKIGALGRVQAKTGLPLYIHTLHQDSTVKKALNILFDRGATPEKIIIGHFDESCSFEYICDLLKSGCYACFDRRHYTDAYTCGVAEMLVRLNERGYGDKLLVSNDTCIYSDFCSVGNKWLKFSEIPNTLGFVFDELKEKFCEYGGNIESYDKMLCANPLKVLNI